MWPVALSPTHQIRVSSKTRSPYRHTFVSKPSWDETCLSESIPVQVGHDCISGRKMWVGGSGWLSGGRIGGGSFNRRREHVTRTLSCPESQPRVGHPMSTKTLTTATLGSPVPPFTPHAISVCLPTWKDNVGYEEGEKRVIDSMVTGYPRFFIHRRIQKVWDPHPAWYLIFLLIRSNLAGQNMRTKVWGSWRTVFAFSHLDRREPLPGFHSTTGCEG